MKYDSDDLQQGIWEGQRRADLHHLSLPNDQARLAEEKIRAVLTGWPTDLSGRFVQLFCELMVLAEAARRYKEEALKEDEVRGFLGILEWFLNGFKDL